LEVRDGASTGKRRATASRQRFHPVFDSSSWGRCACRLRLLNRIVKFAQRSVKLFMDRSVRRNRWVLGTNTERESGGRRSGKAGQV